MKFPNTMNNATEIYLKCSLCDETHQYHYSDSKFNAIEVTWNSSGENFHPLTSPPETDNKYIVKLLPPLTIKKDRPFWAVYLNPVTRANGVESEEDLTALRFCKCNINKVIELSNSGALVEIQTIEIKTVDSMTETNTPEIHWKTLLDDLASFEKHGSTENFTTYSFISVNVQSDLGIDAIVKKEANNSYIVAVNQWDFHLNEWILCRIPLSKQEETNYGIKHIS